jgi:hypothetical protein
MASILFSDSPELLRSGQIRRAAALSRSENDMILRTTNICHGEFKYMMNPLCRFDHIVDIF